MPERKKQVKTSALVKMETYLNDVYLRIGKGEVFSLDALSRSYKMSGSAGTILKRLNIVKKVAGGTYNWLFPKMPDRALAIVLLDDINRVGGWKGNNVEPNNEEENTLFDSIKGISPELYIAGCIASGMYKELIFDHVFNPMVEEHVSKIEMLNNQITFAALNLINKINNPKS